MTIAQTIKRGVAGVLASDAMSSLARPLARGVASIFMLHRFADKDRGNAGHDPSLLRVHLDYLRRRRYDIVPLVDLIERLRSNDSRLYKTVAFTVDDGYADYATVGGPLFAEFDCPATVFVVTGVTDSGGWYWWDHLRAMLEMTRQRRLRIQIGDATVEHAWTDAATAARVARRIVESLKPVADSERRRVLESITHSLDVDLPKHAPPTYAAMSWDEIRACGRGLTTFGPHTVTHPILSRTEDDVSRFEIEHSWRRLREETDATAGVFCYPNGDVGDVTDREAANLRAVGLDAAVTSRPGYASAAHWRSSSDARFFIPRFPYDGRTTAFNQVASGVERAKLAIRGRP
jgi:peptidoglycan/xylan/chitin deacetylase (PgdA/CDA1 family)